MEIKNYTEYPLCLFQKSQCDYDQNSKKWIVCENEVPVQTFPVIKTLRAPVKDVLISEELLEGRTTITVPIIQRKLVNPDLPPEVEFDVVSVVSFLYISAIKSAGYSTEAMVTPEVCWRQKNGGLVMTGFVGLIVA